MPDYDFKNLSYLDLEILVRDLLQKKLGLTLESFKPGKDKGIDFRHTSDAGDTLVVQCKHYAEAGIKTLLSKLKSEEKEKVKKLNPKRYVLATSVPLNPTDKDKIKEIFSPYIKTTGDIFGKDDLNNLLGIFPDVEKKTIKLWISSVGVLEDFLNGKTKNISKIEIGKIQKHAKYYVYNESFSDAQNILNNHNFCIISGLPGIGKTILAEMLSLSYIDLGWELIKVTDDISDAISQGVHGKKRLFYYDDFLGQTSFADKFNKNEDQRLIDFIDSIRESKSSKLILTTREYILNQARMSYEKLSMEDFSTNKCIVDLSKYNRRNKAEILYNHVYFSDISDDLKGQILQRRGYLKIIDHENYNPRIIDLMTQTQRLGGVETGDYLNAFLSNLDNPLEIWKHAFLNQIAQASRNLLMLMTTLPASVLLEDLELAFLSYNKAHSSEFTCKSGPWDFNNALKELDDNFIKSEKFSEKIVVSFHNPSIRDFLKELLPENISELRILLTSAVFYDQLIVLWQLNELDKNIKKIRIIVRSESYLLISALMKGIDSDSCRLIDFQHYDGTIGKSKWRFSLESKATLALSVHIELNTPETHGLLTLYLNKIIERINNGKSHRRDLVYFLTLVNGISSEFNILTEVFDLTRNLLLNNVDDVDDIGIFCMFRQHFPDRVSEGEVNEIASKFEEVANQGLGYCPDDPETYRQHAYEIKDISDKLGVDLNDIIENLEEEASGLEEEMGFQEEDCGENYPNSGGDTCVDADIISIFNTLN